MSYCLECQFAPSKLQQENFCLHGKRISKRSQICHMVCTFCFYWVIDYWILQLACLSFAILSTKHKKRFSGQRNSATNNLKWIAPSSLFSFFDFEFFVCFFGQWPKTGTCPLEYRGYLSLHSFVHRLVHPSIELSVHPTICLSICLSSYLHSAISKPMGKFSQPI